MDKKEMAQRLWAEWTKGLKLLGDNLAKDQLGIINAACTIVTGSENFIEKTAMFVQRKYYINKFKEYKAAVASYEESAIAVIREANKLLDEKVKYVSSINDIFMDADDSYENEAWGDHAIDAYEKLVAYLNNIMDVLDSAQKAVEEL